MKWPLAPMVLAVVGGIVAGDVYGLHWFGLIWLAAGLATAFVAKRHSRMIALLTVLFAVGWGDVVWRKEIFSTDDLRVLLGDEPQIVTVEGILAETPRERVVQGRQGPQRRFSSLLDVGSVRLEGEWRPGAGRIFVQTPAAPINGLVQGQSVRITGLIGSPEEAANPDAFDFREHLARQEIYFQLHTQGMQDWELPEKSRDRGLTGRFHVWAMSRLQGSLPAGDQNVMLLQAMGLGWKAGLTEEVKEPFVQSGTMHLFAISGLHVALIAVMLVELLRGLGVPRRICGAILIPLLWFYTGATGWQASAIRSSIMMTVIGAGWLLERPSNLLNSLAAAAMIILLADPQQLFQPGFQLSFMVVLSMGLLLPPIEKWRQGIFQPDPFLPAELRPRWQRWLDWPIRFVTLNAATSFAAWLGSLPLIAYYFHLITPVSLLANLALVPLSSLALMSSFGSLLTAWCPPVADLFNHASWILMHWMVKSSGWFADLPLAWWPMMRPGPVVMVSFYVMVLSGLALEWKSPWRWRLTGISALVLMVGTLLSWNEARSTVQLVVLDVRGGDAHVFHGGREFQPLIIDAGSEQGYESAVKPYLKSRAVRRAPSLLMTHGDARHVGGAAALIQDFGVEQLITSPISSRSPGYRKLVGKWQTEAGHLIVANGSILGPWRVLHPGTQDKFGLGDDNAIVMQGRFQQIDLLLLSDLGRAGQRALLERHPDLRADVVVTGIPARDEPVMEELLDLIQPQVLIVSCARQPAGEEAREALRNRLKAGPWKTYYVSDQGSVTIRFVKEGCRIKSERGAEEIFVTLRRRGPDHSSLNEDR